jgi:hypothetical protein
MKKMLVMVLILLVSMSAYAKNGEVFVKKQSSVFQNASQDQAVGSVQIATPLKVIKKKNDFLLVEIAGWSADGSPTVLFKHVGERIIYAVLDQKAVKQIKVTKTKLDDYDTKWNKVSVTAWIKKENVSPSIKAIWTSASNLFHSRCNACHAAPKFDQFSVNQWPGLVNAMKDRAGLMPNEFQLIVKYLQNHSK